MTDLFGNPTPTPSPRAPGEKRWIPEFLLDEASPPPRAAPEDWLVAGIEQDFWITDVDDEDGAALRIRPGDTVSFCWFRSFGTATFTIRPDGTWMSDVPLPAEANGFAEVGDAESMMDTPDGFARAWAGNYFPVGAEDEEEVPVIVYQWSDPVMFRLAIDPDGKARFEEIAHG